MAELKSAFPEMVKDLDSQDGLLSFELAVFARFTMQTIARDDRTALATCFAIAEKFYLAGSPELRDAIDTCYVEDLEFSSTKKKDRRWAWSLFPASLQTLYTKFHGAPH